MKLALFAPLATLLRGLAPLPDAALHALRDITRLRSFEQDAFSLRGGERAERSFYLSTGLVRVLHRRAGSGAHSALRASR